jgi:hypothetical protein
MSQRIEDLDPYDAVDPAKIAGDIYEVSKNSGTSGSPIYDTADSKRVRLDELAAMIGLQLPGGYVPLLEESYLIVTLTDDAQGNGENLRDAIEYALAAEPYGNPLSVSNRFTVILFPGIYGLGNTGIKGLNALSGYVDIIGLGNKKDIIITSNDTDGTIEAEDGADYVLKNISIKNVSVSGISIFHQSAATDNGTWIDLFLDGDNTEDTEFAGWYEGIESTSAVLNGSISGTVIRCKVGSNSLKESTADGKIIACEKISTDESDAGVHLGLIDSCIITVDDDINAALTIGAGAKVRRCTVQQDGAGDCISGSAITAEIIYSRMNKILTGITNSILGAYNIGDGFVANYFTLKSPDGHIWKFAVGDDGMIQMPGEDLGV